MSKRPLLSPSLPARSFRYPVGHVLLSALATNPEIWLGYGTWVLVGQSSVMVGQEPGDPDFGVPGPTNDVRIPFIVTGGGGSASARPCFVAAFWQRIA